MGGRQLQCFFCCSLTMNGAYQHKRCCYAELQMQSLERRPLCMSCMLTLSLTAAPMAPIREPSSNDPSTFCSASL